LLNGVAIKRILKMHEQKLSAFEPKMLVKLTPGLAKRILFSVEVSELNMK